MILKLWDAIGSYFRSQPYWQKLEPLFLLLTVYILTLVVVHQYYHWQYGLSLSPELYLRSRAVQQITIGFLALTIIGFTLAPRSTDSEQREGRLARFLRERGRSMLRKASLMGLVVAASVTAIVMLSPNKVSHIRIKFIDRPEFNKDAFAYLVYELNKLQRNWAFEVDFDVLNMRVLSTSEREECGTDYLCYTIQSVGRQVIGITNNALGRDRFWQNRDTVSVISTHNWDRLYAPPSVYEFLAHAVVVQSILIHLSAHCGGLPEGAFAFGRVAYGDLFQFSPRRSAMKAQVLAGHLSRDGEQLLLNCFGAQYLSVATEMLMLEWLYSDRVVDNLERSFGITF
jgi:hypothetical protein